MKTVFLSMVLVLASIAAPAAFADTCWVTYYEALGEDNSGDKAQIFGARHGTYTVLTVTATEQSSTFPNWAHYVRLICDIQVFYEYGANPTATTSTIYLPADTQHVFEIAATGTWEVAVCDSDCT